jgi:hypothetical protein
METKESLLEPLLERAEAYGTSSFNLLKLKTVDKTSEVLSSFVSRLLFGIFCTIFLVTLNIAIALWLGDLLGKSYYGFFIVAGFYGIIGLILYLTHPAIKEKVSKQIIQQILN